MRRIFHKILCVFVFISLVFGTSCAPNTSDTFEQTVLDRRLPNALFVDSLPEKSDQADFYSTTYMCKINSLLQVADPPSSRTVIVTDPGLSECLMMHDSGMPLNENESDAYRTYLESQERYMGVFYHNHEEESEEFYTDILISCMLYEFSDQYNLGINPPDEFVSYIKNNLSNISFEDSSTKIIGLVYAASYMEISCDCELVDAYLRNWLSIGEDGIIHTISDAINVSYLAEIMPYINLPYSLDKDLINQILSQINLSYTDVASLYLYAEILDGFSALNSDTRAPISVCVKKLDQDHRLPNNEYTVIYNITYSLQATSCALYIYQLLNKEIPDKEKVRQYVQIWYDENQFQQYSPEELYYYYVLANQTNVDVDTKISEYLSLDIGKKPKKEFIALEPRELFCYIELYRSLNLSYPDNLKTTLIDRLEDVDNGSYEPDTPASVSLLLILSSSEYLDVPVDKGVYRELYNKFDLSQASIVDLFYYPKVMSILDMQYNQQELSNAVARLKKCNGYIISPSCNAITMFSTAMGLELETLLNKKVSIVFY